MTEKEKFILESREKRMTYKEIGKLIGVSRQRVHQILRDSGSIEVLSDTQRFIMNLESLPNGCIEWRGGKNTGGYGHFSLKGKNMLAHRFAYELYTGKLYKKRTKNILSIQKKKINL